MLYPCLPNGGPGERRSHLPEARRDRPYHAEPAAGAERADHEHGARHRRGAGHVGNRSGGDMRRRRGRGRKGVLRRRRHPAPVGAGDGGRPCGATRLLARGIHPQRADQALSKTLCRRDRRHRHGRRRRRVGARLAPDRRRRLHVRHARGRHRLLPGCRRDLLPAAAGRPDRNLSRPDRRACESRRRRGARPRRRPRFSRANLRRWWRRWRAARTSTGRSRASPRRPRPAR